MHRETVAHSVSATLVAGSLIAGQIVAGHMPPGSRLPVHFDASGAPDQWASPALAVSILPLATLGLWILFGALSARARKRDIPLDSTGFICIWLASLGMLTAFQALLLSFATGGAPNVDQWTLFLVGTLLAIFGFSIQDLPRNSAVGMRFPSTLRDERVWRKTHAYGRIVFLAAAVILYGVAISDPMIGLPVVVGVLLLVLIASAAISLFFGLRLRDGRSAR